jgi:hypothetical protein
MILILFLREKIKVLEIKQCAHPKSKGAPRHWVPMRMKLLLFIFNFVHFFFKSQLKVEINHK